MNRRAMRAIGDVIACRLPLLALNRRLNPAFWVITRRFAATIRDAAQLRRRPLSLFAAGRLTLLLNCGCGVGSEALARRLRAGLTGGAACSALLGRRGLNARARRRWRSARQFFSSGAVSALVQFFDRCISAIGGSSSIGRSTIGELSGSMPRPTPAMRSDCLAAASPPASLAGFRLFGVASACSAGCSSSQGAPCSASG